MDRSPTLYLNHAGTSWPKPEPVRAAVEAAYASDPRQWPVSFERDHRAVAARLGLEPDRLLLTPGCTSALALALADLPWAPGDRVLTSSFEHHAMMRPLRALEGRGVEVVQLPPAGDAPLDLDALDRELGRGARAIALSHASNVTGALLPVEVAIAKVRAAGGWSIVDAAQTAGWLPLPTGADVVAFAGHKGPQAPWGVGGLFVGPGAEMATPSAACSLDGSTVCATMPGYCDGGSVDRAALAGLVAGLAFMAARPERLARARAQVRHLEAVAIRAGIERLGPPPDGRVPTLALRIPSLAEVQGRLAAEGVVASVGVQCAPAAHESLGTAPEGALRLSVGPDTSDETLERAAQVLARTL